MADFPSKVTTETSSPNSQSSHQGGNSLGGMAASISSNLDMSFIRSVPAILMLAEIVLGFLHWVLVASTPYTLVPEYGWVMFVAVTLWIITTILFIVILFSVQRHLAFVPWPLTVMMYNGVAAVLYLTAFLTNAATVNKFWLLWFHGHIGAAAFFAAASTLAYGVSAFFSYMDWRSDGGNAATNTVPT
ncbi:plasmolipin [Austrofundulus limnaeus]|uniref:Plasmolipin n=1 Tax=Austrofundulus limnaeus TaxID=52670 RepID=A0A2I4DB40_AUSLI|nr:PREDICTED: plasmolipin [Austrofundulus limnaeus]